MAGPLAGKTALVTGATRGIGCAVALRLLADGARVIGTGTKPNGKAPDGCAYEGVDLADPVAAEAFAGKVAALAPDILVNNAGVNRISPFAEIEPATFVRMQQINVTAPFLLCRAVLPGMKAKGWGRIVNIGSIFGIVAKEGRGAYATSKFALDGMTAALAAEVARHGILANCVAPGPIDTDLTRGVLGEEGMRRMAESIPLGRLGKPEEVAALVAWLAGIENTYVSGQNIAIDGGYVRV
jgi:NAD(P)-dependent dehydrogenase (short-subunit alcohol dehydrogenase family)